MSSAGYGLKHRIDEVENRILIEPDPVCFVKKGGRVLPQQYLRFG